MFLLEVKPWKSSKWQPPVGEELVTADRLRLNTGGRTIQKRQEAGAGHAEQDEGVLVGRQGESSNLPHVPVVDDPRYHLGAGVRGDSMAGIQ
jgi:SP family sugar:H+ symporter-like MFS transporter